MEKAIEAFATAVEDADVAVFYYAGHGMQHQGVNYLMPVDANLQSAAGLRRLTKLNDIVADVKRARTLRIMILDACRDNPLLDVLEDAPAAAASRSARSVGLAKLSTRTAGGGDPAAAAPAGAATSSSTPPRPGSTAADGRGRNSPFSAAFVRNVETEGQEVVALVRRVALSVQQETNGGSGRSCRSRSRSSSTSSRDRRSRRPPCSSCFPLPSRTRSAPSSPRLDAIVGAASEQDRVQTAARADGAGVGDGVSVGPQAGPAGDRAAERVRPPRQDAQGDRGIPPPDGERAGHRARSSRSPRRPSRRAAGRTCRRPTRRWPRRRRATTRPSGRAPRRSIAHAATAPPCPSSAATSPRPTIARRRQRSSISRRPRTRPRPTSRTRRAGSRSPEARCSSTAPISSPTMSCARRSASSRARPCARYEQIVPTSDEHKRLVAAYDGDRARQHRRRADEPRAAGCRATTAPR